MILVLYNSLTNFECKAHMCVDGKSERVKVALKNLWNRNKQIEPNVFSGEFSALRIFKTMCISAERSKLPPAMAV